MSRRPLLRRLLHALIQTDLVPTDLLLMLRGQTLVPDKGNNPDPCQAGTDPKGIHLPLLAHDIPQLKIPLEHIPKPPRHRLMCPLHERALAGQLVPCATMAEKVPLPADKDGKRPRQTWKDSGMKPCRIFHMILANFLPELLGLHAGQPWPAGDLPVALLRSMALTLINIAADEDDEAEEEDDDAGKPERDEETLPPDSAQNQLRFLLATGRLSEGEVREMVDHMIFVLDPVFMPCKDDPQRDQPAVSAGKGTKVPAARFLCPLQVRAMRGDTTVPCSEAPSLKPAASLLRRVREDYPKDALKRRRPPQPVYWMYPDERPGGPADIVRKLKMRPCQLLGEVFIPGIVWLMKQTTVHEDEDEKAKQAVLESVQQSPS